MDHVVPQNLFQVSYFAWFAMELWILSRDRRRFTGRVADRGSFFGFFICYWAGLGLAFYAFSRHPEWRMTVLQPALSWLGIVMVWAGMAFRLWAVLTLGAFFRTSVVVQHGHRLVTAGPYRWLRHPAYTGAIITTTGLGLAFGNWASLAALLVFPSLAIAFRIHVEERALTEQFGEAYRDFSKNRSAVIPAIW
jgi:protein-S-isoprenylcysteine O-methyltransferase Ste14